MRVLGPAMAIILASGASLTAAPPVLAEDLCYRFAASELDEATGYAWSGTVTEITRRRWSRLPREFRIFDVVFDVDGVYRDGGGLGGPAPHDALVVGPDFRLTTTGCQGIRGLRVGRRYLVSAGDLGRASTSRTVAWRLVGTETTLVRRMYADPATIDPELAGRRGLIEVLEVVAPEAAADLVDASRAVALIGASIMAFLRPTGWQAITSTGQDGSHGVDEGPRRQSPAIGREARPVSGRSGRVASPGP